MEVGYFTGIWLLGWFVLGSVITSYLPRKWQLAFSLTLIASVIIYEAVGN